MAFDRESWNEQRSRWKHFEAWELERTRESSRSFEEALAWMSEAWELARRFDPTWGSAESAPSHSEYLAEIRSRLEKGSRRR